MAINDPFSARITLFELSKVHAMRRLIQIPVLLLVSLLSSSAGEVIELGSRRELFVDKFLIEKMESAQLKMHEPHREEPALKFDAPWEGGWSCYVTVMKDGDIFRMIYRGLPIATKDGTPNESVCYAESKDGIAWTKPNLGLFEVFGTRSNNVVWTNVPYSHNFSTFLDERPGVPKDEKFKALAGYTKSGLHAFKSPDSIHWSEIQSGPVITKGAFDSQNVAFWSVAEQQYICYFRIFKQIGKKGCRWVSRTTSKDFLNWSEPVEMEFGDAPPEELYTNGTHPYFRAPHIYIALAKRFFPGKVALSDEQAKELVDHPGYRKASSDSIFMTTRGGNHYERTFLDAFIRPGPTAHDWIARDNTPALGVVPANEREMSIYRVSHYAQPSVHLARYTLRTDGFISINAPYRGGEVVTKPFTFTGNKLEMNFATSAGGGVQVEIQDGKGQPLPGFALSDCHEMIGDDISRIIAWTKGSDVSSLAGKTVKLRVTMKDADLYSLRFF
ncbi:MAG: hypothetical protein JWM68_3784 [Verrucomicrobiales bacterium]|nr:hypothetical protein [Verrucomicrobiales bacterium]